MMQASVRTSRGTLRGWYRYHRTWKHSRLRAARAAWRCWRKPLK